MPIRLVRGMRKKAPRALQTIPDKIKMAACLPILLDVLTLFSFILLKLFQEFVSIIQKFFKRVFTNEKICVRIMARINVLKEKDYGF